MLGRLLATAPAWPLGMLPPPSRSTKTTSTASVYQNRPLAPEKLEEGAGARRKNKESPTTDDANISTTTTTARKTSKEESDQ